MTPWVNLIPAAGEGQRFKDEGFAVTKPLIRVLSKPMLIQAAKCLPHSENNIFIVRKNENFEHISNELIEFFPHAEVIPVDYLTQGQASTCMLAENAIPSDAILQIGACDNGMIYSRPKFQKWFNESNVDIVIWTFRNHPTVTTNPKMYSWVQLIGDKVSLISCKTPISMTPEKDHAVVGSFTFRRAEYFFDATRKLIGLNRRINNEFYVDDVINILIEDGFDVKVFEIDHYVGWGTPNDLRTFEYWEKFFAQNPIHVYKK